MNYKKLVFVLVLGGLASSISAMEEGVERLKISDDIKIVLKDAKEVVISRVMFERFKSIVGVTDLVEHDVEKKGSFKLPSITKDQFNLIMDNLEDIEKGNVEELVISLNNKSCEQLKSLIDAANYLDIKAIMDLVAHVMSLFENALKNGDAIESMDLVMALLIPEFVKLHNADLYCLEEDSYLNSYLNSDAEFVLMRAAKGGREDIVGLLIKAGANLDKKNDFGTTALIGATEMDHKDIVELLIKAGADLGKQNWKGTTALIMAAEMGHKDIVELLIKAGADLDEQTWKGATALILAAKLGRKDVLELLIEAGADLDKQNKLGETALISATKQTGTRHIFGRKKGYKDIIKLLIDAGADDDKKDKDGDTAYMWASENGDEDVVELLI